MAKKNRLIIKLISSSGHFYTTVKNKKNTIDKIMLKKYDPVLNKHNIYKEQQLKKKKIKSNF